MSKTTLDDTSLDICVDIEGSHENNGPPIMVTMHTWIIPKTRPYQHMAYRSDWLTLGFISSLLLQPSGGHSMMVITGSASFLPPSNCNAPHYQVPSPMQQMGPDWTYLFPASKYGIHAPKGAAEFLRPQCHASVHVVHNVVWWVVAG